MRNGNQSFQKTGTEKELMGLLVFLIGECSLEQENIKWRSGKAFLIG